MACTIRVLKDDRDALSEVRKLWRQNSATLGYFPEGAFQDYAKAGSIIVALEEDATVVGYLLYRRSAEVAVLVHLCVASSHRGSRIPAALLEAMKRETAECRGIRLTCRADFPASRLWPRLGFTPCAERAAREPGKLLKVWWFDHGHPDLFTQGRDSLPVAVLDANVFYDLHSDDAAYAHESRSLMEGWVHDTVRLHLSPEIYQEIDRNEDAAERLRHRRFATEFPTLRTAQHSLDEAREFLKSLAPRSGTPSNISDREHLAHALGSGARYFVTRDKRLLKLAIRVATQYSTTILRPSRLIAQTDESLNRGSYSPARLSGTSLSLARCTDDLLRTALPHFADGDLSALQARVRSLQCRPSSGSLHCVSDLTGRPLALYGVDDSPRISLEVPVLRVLPGPLAATLFRHLLWMLVRESVEKQRRIVNLTDPAIPEEAASALASTGYKPIGDYWYKVNIPGPRSLPELASFLGAFEDGTESTIKLQHIGKQLAKYTSIRAREQAELESLFWPLIIADGPLPVYLVPIRPEWAMHLFHERIASGDLFGADPKLILNAENVYYRSSTPRLPVAPSRVLWYVSSGKGYPEGKHVVGTSLVTGSETGRATDLYRQYRHLGIYKWKDVLGTAKGNKNAEVLAFTFSSTQLFRFPVPWKTLQTILIKHMNRRAPFQAPIRVPPSVLVDLYDLAETRSGK